MTIGLKSVIMCLQVIKEVTYMPDDEKKKDIGEVVSVLLNLNDQNRQLMLFGAQLLEKSELMAKIQQSEHVST